MPKDWSDLNQVITYCQQLNRVETSKTNPSVVVHLPGRPNYNITHLLRAQAENMPVVWKGDL